MTASCQLAYVQTRLQARHGQRPTEESWRLLEATPDLAAYLQSARRTILGPWIAHMPAELDVHRIERSLRDDWGAFVRELADWAPAEWQAAIRWFVTAPYLTHLVHLSRGEFVPPWMRDDPVLNPFAIENPAARAGKLEESPMAPVLSDISVGTLPITAWMEQWLAQAPADADEILKPMSSLVRIVAEHFQALAEQSADPAAARGHREALRSELLRRFRRYARTPVAIFAYLGLALLDFERLRGGLVLRALFPNPAGRPTWA